MTALAARTASSPQPTISIKTRSRHWEVTLARLEDTAPTLYDPVCLVNDAAAPGSGPQITGTYISDFDTTTAVVDVEPGMVYHHNVRTALTYSIAGAEESWAALEEGSPVYYDRSSTMPALCFLSLSPKDENGADNAFFGVVVRGPEEVAADFPKAAGASGNTHGAAVMQLGVASVGLTEQSDDPNPQTKIQAIPIASAPTGSEQDSGFALPAKSIVKNVWVDVTAAEATGATKTLDVGTDGSGSNDPNGFLAALDVSGTGVLKGTLLSSGQTLGALLSTDEGGTGELVPEPDVASGGESVTFTAGSADWVEFRGTIYVEYVDLT